MRLIMAKIEPFCGVRYNCKKIKNLSSIVCPPYDVINKQQRKLYFEKSRYNAVALVLPKGKNRVAAHKNSKMLLETWLASGALIRDNSPSIYIYLQRYKLDGVAKSRIGFISLLELDDEKKRGILPHEKIFKKFKFDRFNLMKTTQAHLCPIFTVFNDKGRKIEKLILSAIKNKKPTIDINAEGVKEQLWKVSDDNFICRLQRFMRNKRLFIADGHHRFEASLHLKCYMRKKNPSRVKMPYDYTMAYFLNIPNKGLTILPTHRAVKSLPDNFTKVLILKRLSEYFSVSILKNKKDLFKRLHLAYKQKRHAFSFFYKNSYIFALLKNERIIEKLGAPNNCLEWRKLDVSILHHFILPRLLKIKEKVNRKRNIYYFRGVSFAEKMVKSGRFKMAIFLNPTKIEQVEAIARANNRMPHKSTYFYPKPLTGLVFHKF